MTIDRAHLSIGEVLALLQDDFPDVTISKIRFLEGQGLLVPERTPSGYRKFHDEDIVRLRWILTQQRDHFLPLKVIKERIQAGDLGTGPPDGVLPFGRVDEGAIADDDPMVDPPPVESSSDEAPSHAAPTDRSDPDGPSAAVMSYDAPFEEPFAMAPVSLEPLAPPSPSGRGSFVGELLEGPTPTQPPRARRRHPVVHQKGDPTPPPDDDVVADDEAEGETHTRDELAERSGLGLRGLAELERYGLVSAQIIGDSEYFDDDALVVARLAAGFSRYGIEPRHLRMYKVSAEREAGMFEQLIMPLLKQRRAAAREEAVEVLEDLAELADDLRAVMVRSALREYLGRA